MNSKLIKCILLSLFSIVSIQAITNRAAIAQEIPKIETQRRTAKDLGSVSSKTYLDDFWGVGAGEEATTNNYQIEQNNPFFPGRESLPTNDRYFNVNNLTGSVFDDSGEAVIFKF